jgi:hypothetical protein
VQTLLSSLVTCRDLIARLMQVDQHRLASWNRQDLQITRTCAFFDFKENTSEWFSGCQSGFG